MALVFILSVFIWDLQCKNHFNRKMVFRVTKSQYERQMITYLILHDHPDWVVANTGLAPKTGPILLRLGLFIAAKMSKNTSTKEITNLHGKKNG